MLSGRRKWLKLVGGGGRSEVVVGVGVIKKVWKSKAPPGAPPPGGWFPGWSKNVFWGGGIARAYRRGGGKKCYSVIEDH